MSTPLYYARVRGGLTGLVFQVGASLLFLSDSDRRLYLIEATALDRTVLVPSLLASHLRTTLVEPTLQRLVGRAL